MWHATHISKCIYFQTNIHAYIQTFIITQPYCRTNTILYENVICLQNPSVILWPRIYFESSVSVALVALFDELNVWCRDRHSFVDTYDTTGIHFYYCALYFRCGHQGRMCHMCIRFMWVHLSFCPLLYTASRICSITINMYNMRKATLLDNILKS